MKKLEKLKLHNLEEICADDQKKVLGGYYLYWSSETGWTYMCDEVVVIGSSSCGSNWNWGPGSAIGSGSDSGGTGSDYSNNPYDSYIYGQTWNGDCYYNDGGGSGTPYYVPVMEIVPIVNNCSPSVSGLDYLKSWEKSPNGGVALTIYDDNGDADGGFLTIGWGHQIQPGEDFSAGITADQANAIFLADLQKAINDVNNSVTVSLTQSQFDALVSYSFNIGSLAVSPNCLAKLNNGDYAGAAAEMNIVTEHGQTMPGLVTRREDERNMFLNGIYTNHN